VKRPYRLVVPAPYFAIRMGCLLAIVIGVSALAGSIWGTLEKRSHLSPAERLCAQGMHVRGPDGGNACP